MFEGWHTGELNKNEEKLITTNKTNGTVSKYNRGSPQQCSKTWGMGEKM